MKPRLVESMTLKKLFFLYDSQIESHTRDIQFKQPTLLLNKQIIALLTVQRLAKSHLHVFPHFGVPVQVVGRVALLLLSWLQGSRLLEARLVGDNTPAILSHFRRGEPGRLQRLAVRREQIVLVGLHELALVYHDARDVIDTLQVVLLANELAAQTGLAVTDYFHLGQNCDRVFDGHARIVIASLNAKVLPIASGHTASVRRVTFHASLVHLHTAYCVL